jgi:hypothetical protein
MVTSDQTGADPVEADEAPAAESIELRREAYTMALYVAVCLHAALLVADDTTTHAQVDVIAVVWGTTLGLALAHFFAFRLSARLVGSGEVTTHDAKIGSAQLVGAAVVALLCTVPIVLLQPSNELGAVRLVLAAFIALVAYAIAIDSASTRWRAAAYAVVILLVALVIAITKNWLSGH